MDPQRGHNSNFALARPSLLALWAVAFGLLFLPYRGITHDAILYAAQTLHSIDPVPLQHDLFFRYGSQSRFTIFDTVMAPLVSLGGIEFGFWFGYIISALGFVLAVIGLCKSIGLSERTTAITTLLSAVYAVPYGAEQLLHINEPFLTPRLASAAFTIAALSSGVCGRWVRVGALLLIAFLLHPIIALPGALCALLFLFTRLTVRTQLIYALFTAATLLAFFLWELRAPFLTRLDPEWLAIVKARNDYFFPSLWSWADLLRAVVPSALCFFISAHAPGRAEWRSFVRIAGVIGLGGVIVSAIVEFLPYALPLQLQLYRTQWLSLIVLLPVLIALIEQSWAQSRQALFATSGSLLLCYLFALSNQPENLLIHLLALPLFACRLHGVRRSPRNPRWLMLSLTGAVYAGAVLELSAHLYGISVGIGAALEKTSAIDIYFSAVSGTNRIIVVALGYAILNRASAPILALLTAIIGAIIPLSLITSPPQTGAELRRQELARVAHEVSSAIPPSAPLYIPGEIKLQWLELRREAYFDIAQMAGNVFNREVAIAGRDRLRAIAPFELERHKDNHGFTRWISAILGSEGPQPIKDWSLESASSYLCSQPGMIASVLEIKNETSGRTEWQKVICATTNSGSSSTITD